MNFGCYTDPALARNWPMQNWQAQQTAQQSFSPYGQLNSQSLLGNYAGQTLSVPMNHGPCAICGNPIVPCELYDPVKPKITVHGVHTISFVTEDIEICDACFKENIQCPE
jgi:hypothetical protein